MTLWHNMEQHGQRQQNMEKIGHSGGGNLPGGHSLEHKQNRFAPVSPHLILEEVLGDLADDEDDAVQTECQRQEEERSHHDIQQETNSSAACGIHQYTYINMRVNSRL